VGAEDEDAVVTQPGGAKRRRRWGRKLEGRSEAGMVASARGRGERVVEGRAREEAGFIFVFFIFSALELACGSHVSVTLITCGCTVGYVDQRTFSLQFIYLLFFKSIIDY
jgi:hypothetical protein